MTANVQSTLEQDPIAKAISQLNELQVARKAGNLGSVGEERIGEIVGEIKTHLPVLENSLESCDLFDATNVKSAKQEVDKYIVDTYKLAKSPEAKIQIDEKLVAVWLRQHESLLNPTKIGVEAHKLLYAVKRPLSVAASDLMYQVIVSEKYEGSNCFLNFTSEKFESKNRQIFSRMRPGDDCAIKPFLASAAANYGGDYSHASFAISILKNFSNKAIGEFVTECSGEKYYGLPQRGVRQICLDRPDIAAPILEQQLANQLDTSSTTLPQLEFMKTIAFLPAISEGLALKILEVFNRLEDVNSPQTEEERHLKAICCVCLGKFPIAMHDQAIDKVMNYLSDLDTRLQNEVMTFSTDARGVYQSSTHGISIHALRAATQLLARSSREMPTEIASMVFLSMDGVAKKSEILSQRTERINFNSAVLDLVEKLGTRAKVMLQGLSSRREQFYETHGRSDHFLLRLRGIEEALAT